ncbi:response regulator transcription factor [Longibaculum muris]|uniref:response regulator transcription factor n=1 Tax=Longibaculum muris TaxID=1796628 RepID=UPI0022E031E6|nr:response regulator transcription factor [Longibaculum muris]
MRILIVEDDQDLCQELKLLLDNAGYDGMILKDFEHAKEEILALCPDLVLLDITIPFMNGELLLKELRKETQIPIIMVTSQNNEVDEVLSMSYGADDYICKPYNPTLLLLRIEAVLRRVHRKLNHYTYRDLVLIPDRGIVKCHDETLILTKNEMFILKYLIIHQGQIASREEIMMDLWDSEEFVDDNTLTVNMSRLRQKLRCIGYGDVIETRKGLGYILV